MRSPCRLACQAERSGGVRVSPPPSGPACDRRFDRNGSLPRYPSLPRRSKRARYCGEAGSVAAARVGRTCPRTTGQSEGDLSVGRSHSGRTVSIRTSLSGVCRWTSTKCERSVSRATSRARLARCIANSSAARRRCNGRFDGAPRAYGSTAQPALPVARRDPPGASATTDRLQPPISPELPYGGRRQCDLRGDRGPHTGVSVADSRVCGIARRRLSGILSIRKYTSVARFASACRDRFRFLSRVAIPMRAALGAIPSGSRAQRLA